jgi:hypothetical protein
MTKPIFSDVGIDKQDNQTTEEIIDDVLRHLILGVEFFTNQKLFCEGWFRL